MRVTPICHSGFLLETESSYYLFDYYRGDLPTLDANKPIVVFCSHAHRDHFNPDVFPLLQSRGMQSVLAVLAKDIPAKRYPPQTETLCVRANQAVDLPRGERLTTLCSTDSGVAFLLVSSELSVFHAGDLNDWTWDGEADETNRQMRGSYRHEVDKLKGIPLDAAFVPLDPRQKTHYADGMLYFLSHTDCKRVYPMHFWGQPRVVEKFLTEYPQYRDVVQLPTQERKGETS